jgi:hypothetical protein
MKTTTLKTALILGGLMLINAQSMNAGISDQLNHFIANELSNFHMQGLYVILGIIGAGLTFYFFSNRFIKDEKPVRQRINYTQQRRQHHRAVIKKTS